MHLNVQIIICSSFLRILYEIQCFYLYPLQFVWSYSFSLNEKWCNNNHWTIPYRDHVFPDASLKNSLCAILSSLKCRRVEIQHAPIQLMLSAILMFMSIMMQNMFQFSFTLLVSYLHIFFFFVAFFYFSPQLCFFLSILVFSSDSMILFMSILYSSLYSCGWNRLWKIDCKK